VKKGIRVTVENLETGEKESREIRNDWMVICDGEYDVHSINKYANGTAQITVKKLHDPA